MKYAVRMELDGKEFWVKLGMKALITLEDKGLDMTNIKGIKMKDILTILHIGIHRSDSKISFDDFVDLVDDSDKTIEELGAVLEKALDIGLGKGKMNMHNDSPKNDLSNIKKDETTEEEGTEESKNV